MPDFELSSEYEPAGDQPEAIRQIVQSIKDGVPAQTLLGITGSGKTFTAANVIAQLNRPTLVLSHNKTLAAQLYGEFKSFFPHNSVEYFVSYYDYYQPEAYLPTTNTYIEKDLSINQEIEKLRLSATSALLSGRKDVIVVSSVSCIYGLGNPVEFSKNALQVSVGMQAQRNPFLLSLSHALYSRSELGLEQGNFRVKGDIIDVFPAYTDVYFRLEFWDDHIEKITSRNPETHHVIDTFEELTIYPANLFVTSQDVLHNAMKSIRTDLGKQILAFEAEGKSMESKRLEERVNYDLEMIQELGYCSGIENYSRYLDNREPGTRPFCLLDYFPDDFLMIIDESHVTIPQIKAMYGGDRSRKVNLVEYGFRLPSAMDNRPLQFEEFNQLLSQTLFVSATPADYELEKSEGLFIEQIIRPTGLLDPEIEVLPTGNQIDDLQEQIQKRVEKEQRVLVTTLTKRMAEELTLFLKKYGVRCTYIHSDVDTMERVEIMQQLRKGFYDVLIGVNLLREGLDLPEVALVAILDADKEGFLRSERSLIQTVGRAARHPEGKAILYADRITDAMQKTIDATTRRRKIQQEYNAKHNIVPKAIRKEIASVFGENTQGNYGTPEGSTLQQVAEVDVIHWEAKTYDTKTAELRKLMEAAAKDYDFPLAAKYRDQIEELKRLKKKHVR